jgi:hypothetical protein
LTVYEATSGAASTGVADLNPAPEVAQTKTLYYKVEPASVKGFPLLYLLEGHDLCNTIATTYSDVERRFCRKCWWCGTDASMVS